MKPLRILSGRTALLTAVVVLAVIVWQSGLLDALTLESLKARQQNWGHGPRPIRGRRRRSSSRST
jgi:hypothetical protein